MTIKRLYLDIDRCLPSEDCKTVKCTFIFRELEEEYYNAQELVDEVE